MNPLDENICEQLSAWMDGELPADEARFLERRLANEPALRARWERMQLAASCLKGQSLRPMPASLAAAVSAAIAAPAGPAGVARRRRPWLGWAVAASVALVAILVVPSWRGGSAPGGTQVATQAPAPADPGTQRDAPLAPATTSPDLVAGIEPAPAPSAATRSSDPRGIAAPAAIVASADSLPGSPADFPLVRNGDQNWPRSPLASGSDPALEAYLIRHNQMMGDDGLSGFVPYVDVVTNDPQAAADAGQGEANR